MLKLAGTVLLVYGLLGVVGAVLAYLALQAPTQRLGALLAQLAEQFQHSSLTVKKFSEEIFKGGPLLFKIAEFTGHLDKIVREAGKRFGGAAQSLQNLQAGLEAVKIPALDFHTKTVMSIEVISGVEIKESYPLKPLGNVVRVVGDKIEETQQQFTQAADRLNEVKACTLELQKNLEKSVDCLNDTFQQLHASGACAREISGSKLLTLLPGFAAGFFVLIHLAFALAGYALMTR